jgi:uncharacterized protein YdaU (DUF1376 family)
MNYYPFHLGDYAAHTRNLSLIEDIAYRRMLDAYYLSERPLVGSSHEVAREIGMRDQITDVEYVLGKFFKREGDEWINERADKEIEKFKEKTAQASKAGKASAERRFNARSTPVENLATDVKKISTDVQPTNNHNQEPITKEKSKPPIPPKGAEVSDEFAQFWNAYPKKVGKDAALRVWKKLGSPVATLQNIKTALAWQRESEQWTKDQGQFIPNPATYLSQGRWQDERPEPRNTLLTPVGQHASRSALQWLENGSYEKVLTQ